MTENQPNHLIRGHKAEDLAYRYLRQHGLKLIERNYRCPFGEIDLIMKHEPDCIVFIEVRFRKSTRFGTPAETINHQKQKKLRRAAEHYLLKNDKYADKASRFDIIAIKDSPTLENCEWLQNAF